MQSRFRYTPSNTTDTNTQTNQSNSPTTQKKSPRSKPRQSRFYYCPEDDNNTNDNITSPNNTNNNSNNTNIDKPNDSTSISNPNKSDTTNNTQDPEYINNVMNNFPSIETIRFSTGLELNDLESINWNEGISKKVEFYTGKPVTVTLVNIENTAQLQQSLANIVDGYHPISIDFEWRPDRSRYMSNPISLFQLGSSKGVLIILNSQNVINKGYDQITSEKLNEICPNLSILKEFLSSHSFYGKGMSQDRIKLRELFGKSFNFEDIQETRIKKHKLTPSFANLVAQLAGKPDAQFKDKRVTISNWNKRPLSAKQILYAAFDAYATRLMWEAFVTKFGDKEVL